MRGVLFFCVFFVVVVSVPCGASEPGKGPVKKHLKAAVTVFFLQLQHKCGQFSLLVLSFSKFFGPRGR